MGLSIAYSIIKRHGGELEVESEEGVGTICHIYLPTADRQEKEEKAPVSTAPISRGNILVMDDEDKLREMVAQLLSRIGFKEVELAKDGREAIICSGYSNDPIMSDFRAHGFVGARAKPFRMQQLSDALAEAGCG